jgi:hypothetical protein
MERSSRFASAAIRSTIPSVSRSISGTSLAQNSMFSSTLSHSSAIGTQFDVKTLDVKRFDWYSLDIEILEVEKKAREGG